MQLIFVVEASKESKSDYYYISETLRKYYDTLGHKLTPIYLNGKGNYNKKQSEIRKNISKYHGMSKVIICYDIDDLNKSSYSLNQNIVLFAKNNGYDTIWFYRDIEEVFLRKNVSQYEKIEKAIQFVAHNKIDNVDEIDLSQTIISRNKSSNILIVLDHYLKRR